MAREARLTIVVGRLAVLGVAIVGAHAARGAGADISGFVGTWTFQAGGAVQAVCSNQMLPTQELGGTRVSIYPGTSTDLIFDIGCRCTLNLDVTGSRASLSGTQSCLVIPNGQQLSGNISALTLDRSSDGALTFAFSGTDGVLNTGTDSCALSSLSGSGTLTRTGTDGIKCGDPATAVGVVPYSPSGTTECPFGAGVEDLRIRMHDEDQPPCSSAAGARGEGQWALPDDMVRGEPRCLALHTTTISFCRVDGASFKSMTTAPAPEQFYAVLKLGSVCPNGSIEISKTIDNEDHPIDPDPSAVLGDPGANVVYSDPVLGTISELVFCYFRGAASPDAVMTAFPDLGFHYAVFHAYDGDQPAWVMLKRWIYSNDEDSQNMVDQYHPSDSPFLSEFQHLIENPMLNTFFNMARVR